MGMNAGLAGTSRRGSRRRVSRGGKLNSEINVTPLVDVMLVLLIVFMIVAQNFASGVPIELPKTDANALPSQEEPVTITVDFEGGVFIQDEEISLSDLETRLIAISTNGYDERIFLRGDRDTDYGEVMKVMARINTAGFTNIGLVTDPISQ